MKRTQVLSINTLRNIAIVGAFVLLICRTFQAQLIEKLKPHHSHHEGGFAPLNNTLGFERIAIVSTGTAWRLDGLLKAARYTHVDLEVPLQPPWSDDEVDAFRGKGVPGRAGHIGRGQARCWLGHLNIWREMITRNWATVLVMEDDADWDIAVKQQLLRASPLIRQVSGDKGQVDWSPYGKAWDLLWLGHCGDYIPESPASFMDETLPESSLYRENDGWLTNFPSHLRMVHKSVAPICTYAYALTMPAASKLYELSRQGMDRIITDYLREWCQSGTLRCLTVNPEVFHHHKQAGEVSSDIAVVEGWDDLAAKAKSDYTANIRFSARCSSNAGRSVACQNEFGGVM